MAGISLKPLALADLSFVHEVRNHPHTRRWLHDADEFSLDDIRRWYFEQRPHWLVIWAGEERVGYVRTSDWDQRNASVSVGCDIHERFRRQGFASRAYELAIEELFADGWQRIWLEVLSENTIARHLYESLGFKVEGIKRAAVARREERLDSVLMSLLPSDWSTGKNVKVIATYLGDRRTPPHNASEVLRALRYAVDNEISVDPGAPMDTLLVYNRFSPELRCSDPEGVSRAEEFFRAIDGMQTVRGQLRVLTRENVGLSFGAYSAAFEKYGPEYDYWLFSEDDQTMVADGYFDACIRQLRRDPGVGFVALVGVSKVAVYPPHCHGGVGCTHRRILNRVARANGSNRSCVPLLPFHVSNGYCDQELLGEIPFTNAFVKLGYELEEIEMEEVTVSWASDHRRTPRMRVWQDPDDAIMQNRLDCHIATLAKR